MTHRSHWQWLQYVGIVVVVVFCGATLGRGQDEAQPSSIAAQQREHLHKAAEFAGQIEDDDLRTRVFYALTRAQANVGETDAALESAEQVTANSQLQIYSYLAVARYHDKAGDAAKARAAGEMARQTAIFAEGGKGRVDTHMIAWLAEHHLIEEALAYFKGVKSATQSNFGIRMFCAKLGEKEGGADAALEILESELPPRYHDMTLLMMTQYCAQVGPAEQSLRYINKIGEQKTKDKAYLELVTRQRAKGAKEATLRPWIESISDDGLKSKAQAEAITSRATVKPSDTAALKTQIQQAKNRDVKLALQRKLLASYLANQQPQDAETVIQAMVKTIDEFPRPKAMSKFGTSDDSVIKKALRAEYIKIATVYAMLGKAADAERCEQEGTNAAKAIPDSAGLSKLFVVQMVAGELLKAGKQEAAQAFMNKANKGGAFKGMQAGSAVGLASKGKWDEALAAIKSRAADKTGYWRSQAVGDVIKLAIKMKQLDRAPAFLAALQATDDDYQAYRTAAHEMSIAGKRVELGNWLKAAPSAAKAYAQMGLSDAVGK